MITMDEALKPLIRRSLTIKFMLASSNLQLNLEKLNGDVGLQNLITDKNLHRPQLALAGYVDLFTFHRVQIFGNTEMYYLQSLSLDERIKAFRNITGFAIPCIILTNNHRLDDELIALATEANIPVFMTSHETTKAAFYISEYLEYEFAMQVSLHGSFVDVYGVGVLFKGRSGIGKSEIALDLVERGHRLVADDVVMLTKKGEDILIGTCTSLVNHFMEIRGLGIIDVRQMFGIRAIRFQKRLEIIVELEEFDRESEYDRTGLEESFKDILGIQIATLKVPIYPGKNITVIAEVIALNYLLKTYGYDASSEFSNILEEEISRKTKLRAEKKPSEIERMLPRFFNDSE